MWKNGGVLSCTSTFHFNVPFLEEMKLWHLNHWQENRLIGRGYTCWYWLKLKQNEIPIPREWNLGILTQSEEDKPDSQVKNFGYSFLLKATKNGFLLSLSFLYSLCLTVSDSSPHAFIFVRRLFTDNWTFFFPYIFVSNSSIS